MKSFYVTSLYFAIIALSNLALGVFLYLLLGYVNLKGAFTISAFSCLAGFMCQLVMESLIDLDDFEIKESFSEYLKDYPYGALISLCVLILVALAGCGMSFLSQGNIALGGLFISLSLLGCYVFHKS